jgi:hypothetical protein
MQVPSTLYVPRKLPDSTGNMLKASSVKCFTRQPVDSVEFSTSSSPCDHPYTIFYLQWYKTTQVKSHVTTSSNY